MQYNTVCFHVGSCFFFCLFYLFTMYSCNVNKHNTSCQCYFSWWARQLKYWFQREPVSLQFSSHPQKSPTKKSDEPYCILYLIFHHVNKGERFLFQKTPGSFMTKTLLFLFKNKLAKRGYKKFMISCSSLSYLVPENTRLLHGK